MNDRGAAWDPDPLAAGARVRVRLSGECVGWGRRRQIRHVSVSHGRTGAVDLVDDNEARYGDGHPYTIWPDDGGGMLHDFFARAELERLGS